MSTFKTSNCTILAAVITACLVLGGGVSLAQDSPATARATDLPTPELIKHRRDKMKELGDHMRAVIEFIKGATQSPDEVKAHTMKIKAIAAELPAMFPAGSGMDDGLGVETGAKSEIWKDWSGFEASAKFFLAEVDKLDALSSAPDRSTLAPQFMTVGKEGCSGCHEFYRHKLPGTD